MTSLPARLPGQYPDYGRYVTGTPGADDPGADDPGADDPGADGLGADDLADSIANSTTSQSNVRNEMPEEQVSVQKIATAPVESLPVKKLTQSAHKQLVEALVDRFTTEELKNLLQDLDLDLQKRDLLESRSPKSAADLLVKRAQQTGQLQQLIKSCELLKPQFAETYPPGARGLLTKDSNLLIERLTEFFDLQELHTLLHDLKLDYENFSVSRQTLARELVDTLDRHGRIDELVIRCKNLRPKVQWPVAYDNTIVQAPWERASTQIRDVLANHFDRNELKNLAFRLGFDDLVFQQERLSVVARELILQVERGGAEQRRQLIELIELGNPSAFHAMDPPLHAESVLARWEREPRTHIINNLQGVSGRLRDEIVLRFNLDGIDYLARKVGINPREFDYQVKSALARQLVARCKKHNQLGQLCKVCQTKLSDFECPDGL